MADDPDDDGRTAEYLRSPERLMHLKDRERQARDRMMAATTPEEKMDCIDELRHVRELLTRFGEHGR